MRWFRKPVGASPNRFNSCTLRTSTPPRKTRGRSVQAKGDEELERQGEKLIRRDGAGERELEIY